MTIWKCPEPGCDFSTGKGEKYLRSHYSQKHHKPYPGGGAVPDGTDVEERTVDDGVETGGFITSNTPPVDEYSALRQIMDNNGLNRSRESTISLFQHYDPEDTDALDEILKKQNITPSKRRMVVETYRANLGLGPTEDEEMEEKEKEEKNRKATMPRDPTSLSPAEIMTMNPQELMQWKSDLAKYQQALQFQQQAMGMMYGTVGGFGMPGMMPGFGQQQQAIPKEIQDALKELQELKEERRMQQMMQPVLQQMQAIQQQLAQAPAQKKDEFDDIYKKAMTFKMLDGLGGGKEIEQLRQEANERMERLRMENERQKDTNSQLQIAAMKEIMGGKIATLENMLRNQATPREALTKSINEAIELQQTLQSLKGENATASNAEEKKMMALTDLVGKVTTNLQPVFMELAKGVGKGGQRAAPSVSIEPGAEPDGSSFPCSKCGTSISVVGNPRVVTCPNCGAAYRSEPPEMPPSIAPSQQQPFPEPYMARKAPDDEEIVAELDKQPLEFLQDMAKSKGIDPDLYPLKHDLIRELLRRRS